MRPGSVCRHLKIAGRVPISQFFHVTSQQPRKLQHIRSMAPEPCLTPRATMPSCSILADQKQPATGSFISRGQSSRYFLSGGCYEPMCFSTPPRACSDEITISPFPQIPVSYTHLRAHETVLDLVC